LHRLNTPKPLPPYDLQSKELTSSSQSEKYPPAPLTGGERMKSPLACQGEGVGGEVLKTVGWQAPKHPRNELKLLSHGKE